MKKINIILALTLFSLVAFAATTWTPTTGSVNFHIKNAGITVDGSLKGLSASVKFDENDLANSSIYAAVKVSTINTGIGKRDEHLKAEEYFNATKYPKIEMKSTSFKKTSKGYTGTFDVTIKGKTKSLSMPFTFTNDGETGKFKGKLKLDRTDFGVGESGFILSDDVRVDISLNVKKK
ncbi:MAG: YceI family protein [Bacteroidia bacterium]